MHELSITESILGIVLNHAAGARVTDVHLVIGELSAYVDDSIQLFWDELSRGTVAESATLHFKREPGTLFCLDCQKPFSVRQQDFLCPLCGSAHAMPHGGRECYVESIEVSTPE
ncbi:MAG: hydrogenase maturation nickel metallochaperone HypA [Candidatus Solibacter usitatus]|nr:hydrogenase maturation nickel metallochaperone HypA [Candidatus Solibacter usitatus]